MKQAMSPGISAMMLAKATMKERTCLQNIVILLICWVGSCGFFYINKINSGWVVLIWSDNGYSLLFQE